MAFSIDDNVQDFFMTIITERMNTIFEYGSESHHLYFDMILSNTLVLKEHIYDELSTYICDDNFISDEYCTKLGKEALITSISNTINYEILFENLNNYFLDNFVEE